MSDLELSGPVQAIISALVGSGGGFLSSAIRVDKKFTALEAKVTELENEFAQHKGAASWVIEGIKTKAESIHAIATAAHMGVESLKAKVEDSDRRQRASRQNTQQAFRDAQSSMKLDMANLRAVLSDKMDEEIEKTLRTSADSSSLTELKRRLSDLERKYDKLFELQGEYMRAEKFASFVEEESKRWNDLQRTLGRMEGHIKINPSSPGMQAVSPLPKGRGNSP